MPLKAGDVLENRYRIEELLGQGGMGAVYRAQHLYLDVPVVVKHNLLHTETARRQFKREAGLLAGLGHPNLPRVSDFFLVPDQGQYLIMEYVAGLDLKEVLASQGAVPVDQAVDWMAQVLGALEYLHGEGIIHRDVKPANVKITPDGKVYLVDFGLAKEYDPDEPTTVGARGVTPGFAPPEQYGFGRTDARTDVYSAGATLYALLTGQSPPDAMGLVVGQHDLVPPRQLNADIPEPLEQAVLQAMQNRVTDRFQSAAAFRTALLEPRDAAAPEETSSVTETACIEGASPEPSPSEPPPPIAGNELPTRIRPAQAGSPPGREEASRVSPPPPGPGAEAIAGEAAGSGNVISPSNAPHVLEVASWTETAVTQVAYLQDGNLLAVTSTGSWILDGETLREFRPLYKDASISTVAVSADGATLAFGAGPVVRLGHGEAQRVLAGHEDDVLAVAISPDGVVMASGSKDRTVRLWRVADGQLLRVLSGHKRGISCLAFSKSGRMLASGSYDTSVRLWRTGDVDAVAILKKRMDWVMDVAFSPDGSTLACGSWDGKLRLWNSTEERFLGTLPGHGSPVRSIAFSTDGAVLAWGANDGTIRFCGVTDRNLLCTLECHAGPVKDLAFSPDGTSLASGSWDGTVRLWRIPEE